MAIKLPDPGNGIPEQKTGNDEWTNMKIVRDNFADQSNAASRMVGSSAGNVLVVGEAGVAWGAKILGNIAASSQAENPKINSGFHQAEDIIGGFVTIKTTYGTLLMGGSTYSGTPPKYAYYNSEISSYKTLTKESVHTFWTTQNATRDGNGFLKAASPIIDLYDDHIELNHDAERQGGITFEKLGTGNYMVKGSLGFAQESWYIEMPKDANGNVLVAVVYEQLENNDISIKTFDYMLNKKGRIVPDTETPLDIPTGRCINLRLHEVKEETDEPTI